MSRPSTQLIQSQLVPKKTSDKVEKKVNPAISTIDKELQELKQQKDIYTEKICKEQVRVMIFSSILFIPYMPYSQHNSQVDLYTEHRNKLIQRISLLEQEKRKLLDAESRSDSLAYRK